MLLVAYVLAMTFTLAYGGEHYVVDALVGWVYAAVAVSGWPGCCAAGPRRSPRRAGRAGVGG